MPTFTRSGARKLTAKEIRQRLWHKHSDVISLSKSASPDRALRLSSAAECLWAKRQALLDKEPDEQ